MKRSVYKFGILCLILMISSPIWAVSDGIIRKVVIDPGHGGKDPGATGKISYEKTIALKIALKLGEMIKTAYPDIEVIYTRKDDRFIELHKRTEVANKNRADLFISIHCNANKSKEISGSETYVMGLHKTEQNLQVAKLENAAIFHEDSYESTYDGFDPNSDEDYIALSMFQSAFLFQSLDFSKLVQEKLNTTSSRANRGVKQAGFLVLARTTMPAVLVEVGFISNPNEELFLISDKGQNLLAKSIFQAFSDYKTENEKSAVKEPVKSQDQSSQVDKPEGTVANPPIGNQTQIPEIRVPKKEPSMNSAKTGNSTTPKVNQDIVFMVQVHATKNRSSFKRQEVEKQYEVTEFQHNGFIKYAVGKEKSLTDANKLCTKVRKSGFSDAFVIAFVNGKLTTAAEADKMKSGQNQ